MIQRYEQFYALVSSTYRKIQKIEREEMEKYGLKGAFAQYLLAMDRHPEGMIAAQLCEVCDKDKAAISRALSEMTEKGLLHRGGQSDYRAPIFLTEKGKKAATFVKSRAIEAVAKAEEGLSEQKRDSFYESFELIFANMQEIFG